MHAGERIKALREQQAMRPADIERLSQRMAEHRGNADYFIPHGTLNGIENGSTPSIYKLASLASIFKIGIEDLLLVYGINGSAQSLRSLGDALDASRTEDALLAAGPEAFRETRLVQESGSMWTQLPSGIRNRLGNATRFSYAIVGLNDDTLREILPGGSFVEIDREQRTITRVPWASIRERPIYCLWHDEGHVCCWCEQIGNTVTIVPHPLSRQRSRQLRAPRDVTVVGRVTNSWRLVRQAS